jgi:hypothetical protein
VTAVGKFLVNPFSSSSSPNCRDVTAVNASGIPCVNARPRVLKDGNSKNSHFRCALEISCFFPESGGAGVIRPPGGDPFCGPQAFQSILRGIRSISRAPSQVSRTRLNWGPGFLWLPSYAEGAIWCVLFLRVAAHVRVKVGYALGDSCSENDANDLSLRARYGKGDGNG